MASLTPERVIAGYGSAVAEVRRRVVAYADAVWRARGSYRDADVDALVALLVPAVRAGQLQVANLTSAYIAQVASLRRGVSVPPALVDPRVVTGLRGDPAGVYRRPAVEVYTALSEGVAVGEAVARGARRLESLVATDLQMAKTRQARASFTASGAKRYRRVLNGAGNCALCVLAATNTYRVADLSPIHPGCDCGVDELPAGVDLDPGEVERLHGLVADRFGTSDRGGRSIDYRLITVREHGEIGPVLTWRGQHFDGPAAVS